MGISCRAAAKELGISHPALLRAAREGRAPREPDKTFDVTKCRKALKLKTHPIKSKQARAQQKRATPSETETKRPRGSTEPLPEAIRRKEIALANLREIEEAIKRGELVDVASMEAAWATVGQTIRDNLLGMPDKLTPMLAAMTDKKAIRTYLMEQFRQLLTALPGEISKRAA